jgi:hypothetical protein
MKTNPIVNPPPPPMQVSKCTHSIDSVELSRKAEDVWRKCFGYNMYVTCFYHCIICQKIELFYSFRLLLSLAMMKL